MLQALINLRTLVLLAQFDLDLSVRSARRIIIVLTTLVLGAVLAVVPYLHHLSGPGPVLVGSQRTDRVVITLAVLWMALGVATYSRTRSWISEGEKHSSSSEEFGLRTMLGASVLSAAVVERLASTFLSVAVLMLLSIGALIHTCPVDLLILVFGGGIGLSLYCRSGSETLAHLARPQQKIRHFSLLRMVTPLCLAAVVATGIRSWKNPFSEIHIPDRLAIAACLIAVLLSATALIGLVKNIYQLGPCPLGLTVTRTAQPLSTLKKGFLSKRASTAMRLFVVRPLLSGLMATRWPLALILLLPVAQTPELRKNVAWVAAFIFISTLERANTEPDLLVSGRILRFYYEEQGSFLAIFVTALLTRILAILPQLAVMTLLWHLVAGHSWQALALAFLSVTSDIFASGLAGSSHRQSSQYSIAIAGLVVFTVAATGTAFLWISPLATILLSLGALILAYITWRKNIAYIT